MGENKVKKRVRDLLYKRYSRRAKDLGMHYLEVEINGLTYDEALNREYERRTGEAKQEVQQKRVCASSRRKMLYLREDQALELLRVCQNRVSNAETKGMKLEALEELLAVRYFMLNGLSPMELSNARIEHLDPVSNELFLPRRHWKNDCIMDVDRETVRLQIVYTGPRKRGPLLRSRRLGHFRASSLWRVIKRAAMRTNIVGKEEVSPIILKRTYARLYLKTPGNTVGGLQKSFSHKHLWSTAHYLRFVLEDVKAEKNRMMDRVEGLRVHPMDRLEKRVNNVVPRFESRLDRRGQYLQRKFREKRRRQVPAYVYDPLE